jgi:hypothetical protein
MYATHYSKTSAATALPATVNFGHINANNSDIVLIHPDPGPRAILQQNMPSTAAHCHCWAYGFSTIDLDLILWYFHCVKRLHSGSNQNSSQSSDSIYLKFLSVNDKQNSNSKALSNGLRWALQVVGLYKKDIYVRL